MNKIVAIKSLADMDKVHTICRVHIDQGKPLEVVIREPRVDRSLEQNRLLWKWLTIIAAELGHTKEEMHEIYKEKFLIGIFVRDDLEYAKMASAIKMVQQQSEADYQSIRKQVIALTSTRKCSVKQMTEYLNSIQRHAQGDLDIRLPLPEHKGLI